MAIRIIGARVLVEDIKSSLSLTERAVAAGLHIVVDQQNEPKETMGRVIAVGDDPILHDDPATGHKGIHPGDVVHFGRLAGTFHYIQGYKLRSLEYPEITMVDDSQETVHEAKPLPGNMPTPGVSTGNVYGPCTTEGFNTPRYLDPPTPHPDEGTGVAFEIPLVPDGHAAASGGASPERDADGQNGGGEGAPRMVSESPNDGVGETSRSSQGECSCPRTCSLHPIPGEPHVVDPDGPDDIPF